MNDKVEIDIKFIIFAIFVFIIQIGNTIYDFKADKIMFYIPYFSLFVSVCVLIKTQEKKKEFALGLFSLVYSLLFLCLIVYANEFDKTPTYDNILILMYPIFTVFFLM